MELIRKMAKIQGLGAAFFQVEGNNPELLEWYRNFLKLNVTEYGLEVQATMPILVTFKRNHSNAFINFTVDDIREFMDELKTEGVEVVSDIVEYEYGWFSQIKDIAGNIVELFEVNHETYFEMVEQEKKAYLEKQKNTNK